MVNGKYGTGRFKAQPPDLQMRCERMTGNLQPQRTRLLKFYFLYLFVPITVAQEVFFRSNTGFVSSNPTRCLDVGILLNIYPLEIRQRSLRMILKEIFKILFGDVSKFGLVRYRLCYLVLI
jgi:hypothetical protein